MPEPEKIKNWKVNFFAAYDGNAAKIWGEESALNRRKLFLEEFDKLLNISLKYHE